MQDRMQGDSKLLELAYAGVFGSLFPLFLFAARSFARFDFDLPEERIALRPAEPRP